MPKLYFGSRGGKLHFGPKGGVYYRKGGRKHYIKQHSGFGSDTGTQPRRPGGGKQPPRHKGKGENERSRNRFLDAIRINLEILCNHIHQQEGARTRSRTDLNNAWMFICNLFTMPPAFNSFLDGLSNRELSNFSRGIEIELERLGISFTREGARKSINF